MPAGARVFDGVVEEDCRQAIEVLPVAAKHKVRAHLAVETDAALKGYRLKPQKAACHKVAEVECLNFVPAFSGVVLRQKQQVSTKSFMRIASSRI
jgi:cytochrome c2